MTKTSALTKDIAIKIGRDIADEILRSEGVGTGIWSAIEDEIYRELKSSYVSIWMTDDKPEFIFWLGENPDDGLTVRIENYLSLHAESLSREYTKDEIKAQIAGLEEFIKLMRSHKVALEAALLLEGGTRRSG